MRNSRIRREKRNVWRFRTLAWTAFVIVALLTPALAFGSQSQPGPVNAAFGQVWERADHPVEVGRANRSWTWGPGPIAHKMEPLAESPGGFREVQYYDKARMEVNDPNADRNSQWYVTNGLLVYEMISGRLQVGTNRFEQKQPAAIPVAGDNMTAGPGNFTPTYAAMARVATLANGQNRAQPRAGQEINQMLAADGSVRELPGNMRPGAQPKLQYYDAVLGHNIPDVFWTFMTQRGVVYENGQFREGQVFDWVYALGYPVTEPYWIEVSIKGQRSVVLMQAFQRRLLTYNPANDPQWRVEMGNVGLQYYQWRYGEPPGPPSKQPPGSTALKTRQLNVRGMESRQHSGIEQALYTAITAQAEWQSLWTRHVAIIEPRPSAPAVDFGSEFVLAAFWGNKPNGCHMLTIEAVQLDGNNIRVTVNQEVRGGACTTVIVQPYDLVAVSKAGLAPARYNIVFVDSRGTQLATAQANLP